MSPGVGAATARGWKWYVRSPMPSAAIFLPAALLFSMLRQHPAPNSFIYLAYIRAVVMASGLLTLRRRSAEDLRVKNLVSSNACQPKVIHSAG